MAKIKLVGVIKYARSKNLSRVTVWRLLKNDELDYFTVPGSRRKWLQVKEPSYKEKEVKMLNQLLTY